MKNRHASAWIARRLQAAEHILDKARVETSALILAMIEGRTEAGLVAELEHTARPIVVPGRSQLADARGAVLEGHGKLAAVAS